MARVKKRKKQAEAEDPKRDAFDLYYNGRWTIARLATRELARAKYFRPLSKSARL